jgi:gas vesicle structural protein
MNLSTSEQGPPMPTETRMRAGLAAAPRLMLADSRQASLCEVLDRVLNKGAVIDGEATISVAGIDLVYLGLKLILTSIETARRESQVEAAEFGSATNLAEEKLDGDL